MNVFDCGRPIGFACGMFSSDKDIKSLLVTKPFSYYIKAISYTKCHLVRQSMAPFRSRKTLQFHHIPVERVTASGAQHMLQMTLCVVHRMVGGEEAKEISHTPYLVE